MSERLSDDEVRRRLPPVQRISDDTLRRQVLDLSATAPDYFWTAPASVSGYHHPRCRGEHGLWAHTLMLVPVIDRLWDSYEQRGLVDGATQDDAIAAALLHDQHKEGPRDEGTSTGSLSNHDVMMAKVCREANLPDHIVAAVASHMGPWYDGPEPEPGFQDLIHTADMVASTELITPHLPEPVPRELLELAEVSE